MAALPETRPSTRTAATAAKALPRGAAQREIGSLKVHLVRAELPKTDVSGASDPYVVLAMNTQTFKTDKQKKTRTPKWDLQFRFDVNSNTDALKIQCFDWDRFTKNDLIGEAEVTYDKFRGGLKKGADGIENPGSPSCNAAPTECWISLHKAGKRANTRGRILLKFDYEDHQVKSGDVFPEPRADSLLSSRSVFVESPAPPTPRNSVVVGTSAARPLQQPLPPSAVEQCAVSPEQTEENFKSELAPALTDKSVVFDTTRADNAAGTTTHAVPVAGATVAVDDRVTRGDARPQGKRLSDSQQGDGSIARTEEGSDAAGETEKSASEIAAKLRGDLKAKLKAVRGFNSLTDDTDSDDPDFGDDASLASLEEDADGADYDTGGITEGYSDADGDDSGDEHLSEGSSLEDELLHKARRLSRQHFQHEKLVAKLAKGKAKKVAGKIKKAGRKATAFHRADGTILNELQNTTAADTAQSPNDTLQDASYSSLTSVVGRTIESIKRCGPAEFVRSPQFVSGAAVAAAAALLIWRASSRPESQSVAK